MKLLLRNGRVIDPSRRVDAVLDVALDGDRIERVGRNLRVPGATVVDCTKRVVCPGFIDMHVHLREPGQEWKETIATGLRAAAAGGFTAVACMPNTVPPNDSRAVTELMMQLAAEVDGALLHPIGCVSKGQQGEELAEIGDMVTAGAVAFSDDGLPVRSSLLMRKALEYTRVFDVPVIDHCEDRELVAGGVIHEGDVSMRTGLRGWPGVAEDVFVQRDLLLAEYTGGRVHIAHLSTARAADFVRQAKARGVRATCEVTPHHLLLTDESAADYDTNAKMNPPLRAEDDRRGLVRAIKDGTVDAIATDHAPHHVDEKCVEFSQAPFGVVGLETAVSLCLDRLVRARRVSLGRLVELFTTGPARILKLADRRIAPGCEANLTILDLGREVRVEAAGFRSKSANSPFLGWSLRGAPVATVVRGRLVHDVR